MLVSIKIYKGKKNTHLESQTTSDASFGAVSSMLPLLVAYLYYICNKAIVIIKKNMKEKRKLTLEPKRRVQRRLGHLSLSQPSKPLHVVNFAVYNIYTL